MTRTCLSLTGTTLQENIGLIEKYREWIDIAELRFDFLNKEEFENASAFPELAGDIPLILTIRRADDGGRFSGSEDERKKLFRRCLSGSVPFRYIDLEEDFRDRELEILLDEKDIRIIRSFHEFNGVPENLNDRISRLKKSGREIAKAALMPESTADVVTIFEAMKRYMGEDAIILGMGAAGFSTRILAPLFHGFLTYTSEPGKEAAPGHIDPASLHQIYRFSRLSESSRVFGIIGNPVLHSYSPVIHNAGLSGAGLDGVYVPFQIDSIEAFSCLCPLIGVEGFSVTHPFKEKIIGFLGKKGEDLEKIGACNTVRIEGANWEGENFDWSGFLEPLRRIPGARLDSLAGKRAAVVGAGGAARAVVYALRKADMKVLILNRTEERARELAQEFGCEWAPLNRAGAEKISSYSDLIVQSTSLGMHPNEANDPLEEYTFRGHEVVYDLIYLPERTKLLGRALEAGCHVLNGKRMLLEQAYSQFKYFTGTVFPGEMKGRL